MKTIVFAYSQLGYECLNYLIKSGENIEAVFTHHDNPDEHTWFKSVAKLASEHHINLIESPHPNTTVLIDFIKKKRPDVIFSFYYRHMICEEILKIPRLGSMNMHGSLLPKYRGRAPINWAIIHGEQETGATLHYMVKAADAGDIIDQEIVPISPTDTAGHVMKKTIKAAVSILNRQLPLIKEGKNPRVQQNHQLATYYGGRKFEDGMINWNLSSQEIHNLVRSLLPYPQYPCAFFVKNNKKILVNYSKPLKEGVKAYEPGTELENNNNEIVVACGPHGKDRIFIHRL